MNTGESQFITPGRRGLPTAGRSLWLTGTQWPLNSGVRPMEDRIDQGSRALRDLPSPLHQLARAQNRFTGALDEGCGRLRRNSERMETTVVEAGNLGRGILHDELAALGFDKALAPPSLTTGRATAPTGPTAEAPAQAKHPSGQENAGAPQRAEHARRRVKQNVIDEGRRCALLRAEVTGELESVATWHRQWLDFFTLALQAVQGQQRHEVAQMLSLLHARREELQAAALIARQQSRMQVEETQAAHAIALQNRQVILAEYVQRRQCDTKAEVAERQMGLNERAEAHSFELGRARLELEERRCDQDFVTTLVSIGIGAFKDGL